MSKSDNVYTHAHEGRPSFPNLNLDETSQSSNSRHASHLTLVHMDVEAQAQAHAEEAGSSKELPRQEAEAAQGVKGKEATRRLRRCALPWERKDGLGGYLAESVSTRALIPSLVVQALATGYVSSLSSNCPLPPPSMSWALGLEYPFIRRIRIFS